MNPLDRTLTVLKWPTGLLMLVFLPASLELLQRQLWSLIDASLWGLYGFTAGFMFVFIFLRFRIIKFALTLQHEFSHALFAWLTGHRVSNFTVRWQANIFGESGHVVVHGGNNWLILTAPYFVPIVPVLLVLSVVMFMDEYKTGGTIAILCFAAVLHFVSNWEQSHTGQSDLRKVGLIFAWIFLPTANLTIYGVIIATTLRGIYGAQRYFETLYFIFGSQFDKAMSFLASDFPQYFN